ncbi:MAG: hypothetical protein SFU83_23455 [Meiothermus sp.]|nr:hypothetical protein [Meiothermus sp.]
MSLKFHQVTALPGTLEPDSFYYVLAAGGNTYVEAYITDNSGNPKAIGNTARTNALIAAQISALNQVYNVANIAARNALAASLGSNALVLVTDATGDATVASGAAMYFWNDSGETWTKVAEYESMDVVVQWANITGKPTSTPAQIDSAVANAHTHSNKSTLDKLTDPGGSLLYNGNAISSDWSTNDW